MGWQYRIVKKTHTFKFAGEAVSETAYTMREVYSDKPNCKLTDKGVSWSESPRPPSGDNLVELRNDMEMMLKAFELPVLDEDEWLSEHIKKELNND